MTYGQYPWNGPTGPPTGRHHRIEDEPVDLTKQLIPEQPEYDVATEDDAPARDGKPARHPAVLATIVGVTVFLATITIGGTLLAVNDSRDRKAENYAQGPAASTVTVTESVTTTTTTTVTSRPSRSARPSEDPYGDSEPTTASTAPPGWYAQYGSFTSLESAQEMASRTGADVYNGDEFGQPGQYIVAQREYSRSGAREACDIAEDACIVKQVQ